MMMRKTMWKLLATMYVMFPPVAFSQDKEVQNDTAKRAVTCVSKKKEMSQKHAETMAQMAFEDDIHTGRLTLKQATDYSQCAHENYAKVFYSSSSGRKYTETLARLTESENTREKRKLQAELNRMLPKLSKYMNQAESRCMKKLGLKVTRGKVFGPVQQHSHARNG